MLPFVRPGLPGRKPGQLILEYGFHPELAGSLLAAMVIYGTITGNKQFNEQVLKNAFWSRKLSISSFNSLRQVAIAAIETKL
jgi:hypothetical protein